MRTHLDLFSGIGGFSIAAQNCGYCTVGFCEKEPYAQQILKERFGAVLADTEKLKRNGGEHHTVCNSEKRGQIPELGNGGGPRLHSDIFTLNGADYAGVDLLTGGFPCQPFSVAGKQRGSADDRHLWPEMLRVIKECRPRWIIGENVAGFIKMELDNSISDLEALNYTVRAFVIPACAVDAKHRRDRVWIVAHSNDVRHKPVLREAVSGREGTPITNPKPCGGSERGDTIFSEVQAGEDVADAASEQDNGERGHRERGRDGMGRNEQTARRRDGQADNDGIGGQGEDVANANGALAQGNERAERVPQKRANTGECCQWRDESEWFAKSRMGRVAHGIPNRAHRLRGLGNAIVPQVAQEIIRAILTCDP